MDDTVDEPDAPRALLRKFRIPEGEVTLEELEAAEGLPNDPLNDGS